MKHEMILIYIENNRKQSPKIVQYYNCIRLFHKVYLIHSMNELNGRVETEPLRTWRENEYVDG